MKMGVMVVAYVVYLLVLLTAYTVVLSNWEAARGREAAIQEEVGGH